MASPTPPQSSPNSGNPQNPSPNQSGQSSSNWNPNLSPNVPPISPEQQAEIWLALARILPNVDVNKARTYVHWIITMALAFLAVYNTSTIHTTTPQKSEVIVNVEPAPPPKVQVAPVPIKAEQMIPQPLLVQIYTPPPPPVPLNITANPSSGKAGEVVTVSWAGIPAPGEGTWIGLFDPAAPKFPVVYSELEGKDATLKVPMHLAAGRYEFRMMLPDNTFKSTPFNLTDGPPVPPNPPNPPINPVASKLYMLVFDDDLARTPAVANLLTDKAYWDGLASQGHIYRNMDVKNRAATQWQAFIDKAGGPPCIIVMDAEKHKLLATLPLPADKTGVDSIIKKFTGK